MSVWFCVPSKRPPNEVNPVLAEWRHMGYSTAVLRDPGDPDVEADVTIRVEYPGYSKSVNLLVHRLLPDPDCNWFVTGGDDTLPDRTKTAEQIAFECERHFLETSRNPQAATFGIMQPTGDRWGENELWAQAKFPTEPAYIDRICGSPWMGREFCRRAYGGNGPMWPEFWHMFNDEHMQAVAKKLGILWQRRDLTHHHIHWARDGRAGAQPAFLARANSAANWEQMKAIFERLKAGGFAEAHNLLP